jgi:hypothetical protein
MRLPARQQRALDQIERTLGDDHSGLGPRFDMFTRLAGPDSMPLTERFAARRWRWRWLWPGQRRVSQAVAAIVGLAIASAALFTLTLIRPSAPVCPGESTSIAERVQSVPARAPACQYFPVQPAK